MSLNNLIEKIGGVLTTEIRPAHLISAAAVALFSYGALPAEAQAQDNLPDASESEVLAGAKRGKIVFPKPQPAGPEHNLCVRKHDPNTEYWIKDNVWRARKRGSPKTAGGVPITDIETILKLHATCPGMAVTFPEKPKVGTNPLCGRAGEEAVEVTIDDKIYDARNCQCLTDKQAAKSKKTFTLSRVPGKDYTDKPAEKCPGSSFAYFFIDGAPEEVAGPELVDPNKHACGATNVIDVEEDGKINSYNLKDAVCMSLKQVKNKPYLTNSQIRTAFAALDLPLKQGCPGTQVCVDATPVPLEAILNTCVKPRGQVWTKGDNDQYKTPAKGYENDVAEAEERHQGKTVNLLVTGNHNGIYGVCSDKELAKLRENQPPPPPPEARPIPPPPEPVPPPGPEPTCSDGAKNQDETDVDCGGTCGATCQIDQSCLTTTDCSSDYCLEGVCAEEPAEEEPAFGWGVYGFSRVLANDSFNGTNILSGAGVDLTYGTEKSKLVVGFHGGHLYQDKKTRSDSFSEILDTTLVSGQDPNTSDDNQVYSQTIGKTTTTDSNTYHNGFAGISFGYRHKNWFEIDLGLDALIGDEETAVSHSTRTDELQGVRSDQHGNITAETTVPGQEIQTREPQTSDKTKLKGFMPNFGLGVCGKLGALKACLGTEIGYNIDVENPEFSLENLNYGLKFKLGF